MCFVTIFLRGKTCVLKPIMETDEEARTWAEGVMGSVTLEYTLTGNVPVKWMDIKDEWRREYAAGAMIFGIYHGDHGRMIGTTGLYRAYPVYRSYEFRIIIWDKDSIGKGIGTEATWMVTDYAFRALNANRVWLGCHAENVAAWKVYEKCGYVLEGTLREAIYCYGQYADTKQYAMLRNEWVVQCQKREVPCVGRRMDHAKA